MKGLLIDISSCMMYNTSEKMGEKTMQTKDFGSLSTGEKIFLYTVSGENASLSVTNYGARISSFKVFGRDIVMGHTTLDDYILDTSHQGSCIGRVANRIADAEFTMDGAIYMLPDNNNGACLHGGTGFDRRVFTMTELTQDSITLAYYSPDGEDGFPAGLSVKVKYTLKNTDLMIEYLAVPEGKTPIALTNHSYFNLDGAAKTIYGHTVKIPADRYTEVNDRILPTGNRPDVSGTPYDLRCGKKMGDAITSEFTGYDNYFHLSSEPDIDYCGKALRLAAEVEAQEFTMRVLTDKGGLQFYTGNFLSTGPAFFGYAPRIKHGAMCLETGEEPGIVKEGRGFFEAGEPYTHTTVYSVRKR